MYLQNISKYIKISALYLHFRIFIPVHRAVPRFHGKCSISLSPLQCRPKGLGWQMRFTGVEAACASRTFLRVRDGFQWFSEKKMENHWNSWIPGNYAMQKERMFAIRESFDNHLSKKEAYKRYHVEGGEKMTDLLWENWPCLGELEGPKICWKNAPILLRFPKCSRITHQHLFPFHLHAVQISHPQPLQPINVVDLQQLSLLE